MGKSYACDSCNQTVAEKERFGFTLSNHATKSSSKQDLCGKCMQALINATGFHFVPNWQSWPQRANQ